jgi:SET domain-containing protein
MKYNKTANVKKSKRVSSKKFFIKKHEKARDLVNIRKSNIQKAGLGVFATSFIPKRTTLGEYKGRLLTKKEYDNLKEEHCCYMFELDKQVGKKRKKYFIDARFKKHSNWTRYVNGAKDAEQQKKVNIEAYQYGGKLFYRTCEDVKTGDELLVDYGSDYWTSDEEEESEPETEEEENDETDSGETTDEEEDEIESM